MDNLDKFLDQYNRRVPGKQTRMSRFTAPELAKLIKKERRGKNRGYLISRLERCYVRRAGEKALEGL